MNLVEEICWRSYYKKREPIVCWRSYGREREPVVSSLFPTDGGIIEENDEVYVVEDHHRDSHSLVVDYFESLEAPAHPLKVRPLIDDVLGNYRVTELTKNILELNHLGSHKQSALNTNEVLESE